MGGRRHQTRPAGEVAPQGPARARRRPVRLPQGALVVLAVAGMLAGCTSGGAKPAQSSITAQSSTTAQAGSGASRTIEVRVSGNQVQTAERRVKVKLGEQVRLEVTADRADEVHLHGYDRKVEAQPGRPAVLEFRADEPGVFEVELEEAGLKLLELQVS
jgi:FtsP/CotA-like multicopper oxidase with cupredoxin domain